MDNRRDRRRYSFKKESLDLTYTLDKDTSLTFTADVDFAKFESVAVDGQIISADNYTAKSGSASTKINVASQGTTVTTESETNISPSTGDGTNTGLLFALLILSGMGMMIFFSNGKKVNR